MKKNNKKIINIYIITLLGMTVFLNSCLITAGTLGAIWYLSSLHGTLYTSIDNTERAALSALKKYNIVLYSSKFNETKNECKIEGETIAGEDVDIALSEKEKGITKVSIKIGEWGDHSLSCHILETMQNFIDTSKNT